VTVDVSTDPHEVREARQAGPPRREPVARLLASFDVHPDDPLVHRAMRQDRGLVLERLRATAAAPDAPHAERVAAVRILAAWSPAEGASHARALLASGDAKARARLVGWGLGPDLWRGPLRDDLVALVHDPDPDVHEPAMRTAMAAGQHDIVDASMVAAAAERLRAQPDHGSNWSRVHLLRLLVSNGLPAVRAAARRVLQDFVADHRGSRAWRDAATSLLETDIEDGPLLRALIDEAPEPYVAGRALIALARASGPASLATLRRHLDDGRLATHAVEAIGIAAAGTQDAEAVAALEGASQYLDYRGPQRLIEALLRIGGPAARDAVAREMRRIHHSPAFRVPVLNGLWAIRGLTPSGGLRELARLGIVDAPLDEEAAATLDAEGRRSLRPYDVCFREAQRSYRVAAFDGEASQIPCGHDRIVRLLEDYSAEAFLPEAVLETWQPDVSDGHAGWYTVQFIHIGRLYRLRFHDEGDYYNTRAVLAVVNRALTDAGRPERFHSFATSDQMTALLFAEPGSVREASTRLLLAMEDDAAPLARAVDELPGT
jgi:hypothetical protein